MLNDEQVSSVGRILFDQRTNITYKALLAMEREDWPGILDLTCGSMDPDVAARVISASIVADYAKTFDALTYLFAHGKRPKNMIACGLAGTILGIFQGVQQLRRLKPSLMPSVETRSIWVVGEMVGSTESFMLNFAETIGKNDMNSIDGAVKVWAREDVSRCHELALVLQRIRERPKERADFSDFGKALLGSIAFGAMASWDSMKLFAAVASPIPEIAADTRLVEKAIRNAL